MASFWGLFRTNFTDHFCKLFLFTKFDFSNLQKKVSLNILRSMGLEVCASNYLPKLHEMAYIKNFQALI